MRQTAMAPPPATAGPRMRPHWGHEDAGLAEGHLRIFGVDEVGRGPLAGPVTAAAALLPRDLPGEVLDAIDDSKRVPAARRDWLAGRLHALAPCHVAHASVEEIEALNIRRAAHLAMCRAVAGLAARVGTPDLVLVDGHELPDALPCPARAIVRGDAQCLSIAAASILAKVVRDRAMARLDPRWPGYGFARHAGYPTAAHRDALARLGPTPHHRRGFGPVDRLL